MFGCKVSPGKTQDVVANDDEKLTLKNAVLIGCAKDEAFTLFVHPTGADFPFAVCPLSSTSPHATLDIGFNGKVTFTLEPSSFSSAKERKSKAVAHLIGQRTVDTAHGAVSEKSISFEGHAERGLKRSRSTEEETKGADAAKEQRGPQVETSEDESGDDGEDDDDDEDVAKEVASGVSRAASKTGGGAGDDDDDDDLSFAEPISEEDYKQALIMYLRQHGITTLVKLGQAVKKPKCVKKSLGKFLKTIKATNGKRTGFSLEVEGDKVHLIMKTNYAN